MAPTPAGEAYLQFSRRILAQKKEFEREISIAKLNKRKLTIGVPFNRTQLFVNALIEMERKHPDIQIELIEKPFTEIEDELNACRVDVAFTNNPSSNPNWVIRNLWREELVVYISSAFPTPQTKSVDFSDLPWVDLSALSGQRFLIGHKNQAAGVWSRRLLQENHCVPSQILEIRSVHAMAQIA